MTERRRHVLQLRIDAGEGGARGDDQKRRCDERFGQYDAGEGISQRAVRQLPERAG